MSYNPTYPSVFQPNPIDEMVPGSTPLLPSPYSSSIQAQPGRQPGDVTPEEWDQALADKRAELQAASGFARLQLQSQIDNAEKGRQNAIQLAQLQAQTSRYGTDAQTANEIRTLKQNAAQFEANHQLDLQKFGLSQGELTGMYNGQPTLAGRAQQLTEAQLIAQQRSQPNRLFQTMDLEQALGSVRAGRPATTMPMSTGVAAVDGLSTDYQGNPYLAGSGQGSGQSATSGYVPDNGSGQAAAPDPRVKAVKAVIDALPPSATAGLDPSGVAALNAAFHLYSAPQTARPGTLQTFSPTQKATLASAGDRLQQYTGRTYDDLMAQYTRQGVGQGSALQY